MKTRLRGTVTSDKNAKTLRVEVERRYSHPKYGKIVRGRTVCHTHDPHSRGKLGDFVEIVESRPHSKLKRWELVKILKASDEIAVKASLETEADVPEAVAAPVQTPGNQAGDGQAGDGQAGDGAAPVEPPEGLAEPPAGSAEPAATPEGLADRPAA